MSILPPQEGRHQDARPPVDALDGYVNVLKPAGLTSHDVVARLRRWSGQRRVGHTGTLDPGAVGVLPVAIGRATRTAGSQAWDRKVYWGDVRFGFSTTTDDAEGEIRATGVSVELDGSTVVDALQGFVGDILQRPPAYSALHIEGGERAYHRARTGAATVLPVRPARVDAIEVIGWAPPELSLLVQCHSGTYLRSIARDLGEAVGCPAHLAALVRLRVGPFAIGDALDLDTLAELPPEGWERVIWPPDVVGMEVGVLIAGPGRKEDFAHGRAWRSREPDFHRTNSELAWARTYTNDGEFLGFARAVPEGGWAPTPWPYGATR